MYTFHVEHVKETVKMDIKTLHQIIDEYGIDYIDPEPGNKKLHAAIDELAALRTQVEQMRQAMELYENTCENLLICDMPGWRRGIAREHMDRAKAILKSATPE